MKRVFALLLILSPVTASAGRIMDHIRNYDLNDFALGMKVSVSQNPYTSAQNSVIVYPYLTSFNPVEFTNDWLVFDGGDLGIRKVTTNHWQFGVIGRIETLGFGSEKTEELLGLDDRQWTIEMAPFVGYRGWPVHLKYKIYKEISGRHGGLSQEFGLAYPVSRNWGYIIPSVAISHLDENYTGYYYQVTDEESRPGRPPLFICHLAGSKHWVSEVRKQRSCSAWMTGNGRSRWRHRRPASRL